MDAAEQAHVDGVEAAARVLAAKLNEASEAGVSHALILPRMVMVFREVFGELPPNLMQLLGGMQQ